MSALAWTELAAAGTVLAVLTVTYAVGRAVGRHSVIDVAWGLMFALVAVVAYVGSAVEGDQGRRLLLMLMTVVWGARLAVHIGVRQRGKPEDPRYERFLTDRGPAYVVLMVYGLQGALVLFIAQPVVVGSFTDGGLSWLAFVGLLLWAVGVFFEAVGDHQLERYKRDPDRGPVMDRGLWRYTRHPNYFGDACVWVGIFLVGAERWPGVLTVLSPVVMVYLLAFGSGKRVLERHLADRPMYAEYQRRTSGFLPLPPRRIAS